MKVLINTLHPVDVWNIPEKYAIRLQKEFPQIKVVYLKSKENLIKEIKDTDIYFGWYCGKDCFTYARNLKWIHTPQIGVGKFFSVEGLLDRVILTNASPVDRRQIGEFAFSLFLALHFGHSKIIKNYLERKWARKEIGDFFLDKKRKPLKDMIAVVLGYGGIGKVIAEMLSSVVKEVRIIKRKKEDIPFKVYTLDEWMDYLPDSDAVFIAIPADKTTSHFFNYEKIESFKNCPYIVNVGRGKVVNEKDIAEGLKKGKINGYATDVCEIEPPDENFLLWGFDNVIISPHISALEPDFWEKQFDFFVKNLRKFLNGEKLESIVND
ncbi:conserved hypothetical protein [Thermotomaculum hydrothermale]|uniref:D-isomer specific 2-hydroxyacid dehydrogenase NAD-binding domain-containing protein n=1 Tax=Thermotomaculum hydrothermale TaxID=981385 RepID=A0A7R6PNT2_9BACT|nr:NAD(P)-dependent oxidoreductase [Thermotomaculum hydrothermale]BBB33068.1 conserved hypothetical protein [Thermotomaculum hydrothermale]